MRAAVLYEARTPLRVEEFDLPDIGSTHVHVRLAASGVCHSDWHVVKGDWPHIPVPGILGHEGAGIVEAVGAEVTSVRARRPRGAVVEAQLRHVRNVPARLSEPVRRHAR